MPPSDVLIEIGTEELPPKALKQLSQAFMRQVIAGLDKAQLQRQAVIPYATPRRLALWVQSLQAEQPEQTLMRRGPALNAAYDPAGNPSPATQGFARSCGVTPDQLTVLTTDKGQWLSFQQQQAGQPATALIPEIIQQALAALPIPKRMRWSNLTAEFVRPVHWVVLLLDQQVIETEILGIKTGRVSFGHRFHHPQPLTIEHPSHYAAQLEQAFVLADFATRRTRIEQQVKALAQSLPVPGIAKMPPDLLDEVTALVEWPVALAGQFSPQFLQTPAEALIASMQGHQKYFPVTDPAGQLLPFFITVANIQSRDPEVIRAGNERVIQPRLADAAFFWQQDCKTPLINHLEKLKQVVFQQQLGTVYAKTQRLVALTSGIAAQLQADIALAERAAWLSHCDLLTAMVSEFPELQGIMGRYYALHDGEPEAVAHALDEHYRPRFAGDKLAQSGISQALALAVRLDAIVGIFAIGQIPTGDKDPYGLRRAALGILRTLIEAQLDLNLPELIQESLAQYPDNLFAKTSRESLQALIVAFIGERLKAYYLEQGIAIDSFEAVRAVNPSQPLDFHQRLQAVTAFRKLPNIDTLVGANKRIGNLLKKISSPISSQIDSTLLIEPQEISLAQQLAAQQQQVLPLLTQRHYTDALLQLAVLRTPIDQFFDAVMVMVEDLPLRHNRLALLQALHDLFAQIADLSRLQPVSGEINSQLDDASGGNS